MQNDPEKRALGRVLLTGGTGMVGSSVLRALLDADSASSVICLGRRPSGREHAKLTDIAFTQFGDVSALEPHQIGRAHV